MTVQTSQGPASRLGYGLGRGVRFFLADENVVLRWTKRLVLFAAILFFSTVIFHWLAGAIMTIVSFGLILFVLAKGDFSVLPEQKKKMFEDEDGYRYGLLGYGYYVNGVRIDSDQE